VAVEEEGESASNSEESSEEVDSESSEEVDGDAAKEEPSLGARIGLLLGPTLALLTGLCLALVRPAGMEPAAQRVASVTVWMAVWWMSEAVPLGVTALLPLAAFPPLGILTSSLVAGCYSVSITWLFFGGFQLAFAVERTGLHKRLAFGVMRAMGTRPPCLMLGMMLSIGVLSMFLSNTSTTLMILPVAESMTASLGAGEVSQQSQAFGKALMLGVAYSASMGGIGTIIGTPPNGVLAAQAKTFSLRVPFAGWAGFAAPLALIMVVLTWLYLVVVFKIPRADLGANHPVRLALRANKFGRLSQAEVRVALVFAATVLAWVCRKPVVVALHLPKGWIEDSTISIAAAILLFIIPAKDERGVSTRLMDWQTLLKTPWDILLLFGGGFALATGFKETHLSAWIGDQLCLLRDLPTVLLVLFVVLVVTFLTEVTSNTATANVLLPIIGELALSVGAQPVTLMVPATLAASCAFMLPVATPPNAIVFSTKRLKMTDMAKTGLLLNFSTALLITLWMCTWGRLWFDMEPAEPHANATRTKATRVNVSMVEPNANATRVNATHG